MKNTKLEGFTVQHDGGLTTIQQDSFWLGRLAMALFMAFWMTGWSAVCVMLIHELVTKFT